jgi:hypothetical protein
MAETRGGGKAGDGEKVSAWLENSRAKAMPKILVQ